VLEIHAKDSNNRDVTEQTDDFTYEIKYLLLIHPVRGELKGFPDENAGLGCRGNGIVWFYIFPRVGRVEGVVKVKKSKQVELNWV